MLSYFVKNYHTLLLINIDSLSKDGGDFIQNQNIYFNNLTKDAKIHENDIATGLKLK